jgi:hypothetical protein
MLMQNPMKTIETPSERRLKALEGVVDVEPAEKDD